MNILSLWSKIPATTREPIKSAVVSSGFTLYSVIQPLITTCTTEPLLVNAGYCKDFHSTMSYLGAHWWSIVTAVVINPAPVYRAAQGYNASQSSEKPPVNS